MAEIVDSVKQLSVENDAEPCKNNEKIRTHSKLHLWKREKASDESSDYTISVCGTQRQVLHILVEHFTPSLHESMIIYN